MSTNSPGPARRGPFIALSADMFDDPDIAAAGHMPTLLYIAMACRSRQLRSDGWIHAIHVQRLGIPKWRIHIRRLTDIGLVTAHTDANGEPAWYLPAYVKWNYSEDQWLRRKHEGTLGACKRHHGGTPPCDKARCQDAAFWLNTRHIQWAT